MIDREYQAKAAARGDAPGHPAPGKAGGPGASIIERDAREQGGEASYRLGFEKTTDWSKTSSDAPDAQPAAVEQAVGMSQASFRFYAELNDFLPLSAASRFYQRLSGPPFIKDTVEALGVRTPRST